MTETEAIDAALLPIVKDDVRQTYFLDDAHGDNSRTRISFAIAERTGDGTKVMYYVSLFAENGDPVLDKELECWLCPQ
jgi:hypothetical protein